MLTPEQREEGRRLLSIFKAYWPRKNGPFLSVNEMRESLDNFDKIETRMGQWLIDHADALLADHEIDVAEIKRAAVREFARSIIAIYKSDAAKLRRAAKLPKGYSAVALKQEAQECDERVELIQKLAADRGVKLDEKP